MKLTLLINFEDYSCIASLAISFLPDRSSIIPASTEKHCLLPQLIIQYIESFSEANIGLLYV